MLSNRQILILVVVLLALVFVFCYSQGSKIKEGFWDTGVAMSLDYNPAYATSPNAFPASPYLRFGQPISEGIKYPPAAELRFQGVDPMNFVDSVSPHEDIPQELSGMSKEEINKAVKNRIAKKYEQFEAEDMLPEPTATTLLWGVDPRQAAAITPFMRATPAPMKGRYYEMTATQAIVGSCKTKPMNMGWYYTAPNPARDLVQGAISTGIIGTDMPMTQGAMDIFTLGSRAESGLAGPLFEY